MGEFQITSEKLLAELPRKQDGSEVLRLQFVQAKTPDGKAVAWHSLRIFWKGREGQWLPGKQGITLRGRELKPIVEALQNAISGGQQQAPAPQSAPQSQQRHASGGWQ